jgi:glycosyltransferase involved in cell wall biosynthesis
MDVGPFESFSADQSRESVRASLGLDGSHFVVGTVARLAEHKGHDLLLEALGESVRSQDHWRLLWVGDGWWRERLVARVRSMVLEGRVIMTGLVPPERVPGLMRAMDVLAHPSAREGLPRTVPQALLAGVCPVATDVDGTREACRHEETGLLVPLDDASALRSAVQRLHDDPVLRGRLAQRGRAWCRHEFAAQTMVERLERVYAEALRLAAGDGGDDAGAVGAGSVA